MKILSAQQIYSSDKVTIKNRNILSVELMEQAASKCANWIVNYIGNSDKTIHIFCGIGNNGGDGLVIARKLLQEKYKVQVYIVNFSNKRSEDFKINYDRLVSLNHQPINLNKNHYTFQISSSEFIIDAIFGIGLTRSPRGFVKEIINKLNQSKALIIAIDFPSGLPSLNIGESKEEINFDKDAIVKANITLTFQNPKLAFLLPENEPYYGTWYLLNIGLDKNYIQSIESNYFLTDIKDVKKIYKPRKKFSHKGTYGHSLLIGGSFGKIGAVVLASKAALKIGSGLVTAYVPKCGYQIVQTSIPEVMTEVDDTNELQFFNFQTNPNVIGIGMGMGTSSKTTDGFYKFLKTNKKPLVIDADGLNIISENKSFLGLLPNQSVLTPHPKEFERLVGKWENDYEKLEKLIELSDKYNCIVLLKGANTVIANQHKLYFNPTGNPALSTGGSGDVLTGMITGLIAQAYSPLDAVILATYIHGKSADLAIQKEHTMETFSASDIYNYIAKVIKEILKEDL